MGCDSTCIGSETSTGTPKNLVIKDTEGKLKWEIFPFTECKEVVKVFEYGSQKYGGPFYYRQKYDARIFAAAILRHAIAYLEHEEFDAESGLPHLAHIAANALMALSNSSIHSKINPAYPFRPSEHETDGIGSFNEKF